MRRDLHPHGTMFTTQGEDDARPLQRPACPGVVIVYSGHRPRLAGHCIPPDGLVIGRELVGETTDDRISRQHARVRFVDGVFAIDDLGSRNGTFVAGNRIAGEVRVHAPAVVRTGRTITVLVSEARPFEQANVEMNGETIVGPTLAEAWAQVRRAAQAGDTLLVTGESGTGKELAARAFHEAAQVTGELVAVNCAAIPAGVAERLLFGARRGAYSGADRDADGYLVAADGGTIFLDEIGELEPQVQAKLLRVLETREVLPLGASRPRSVDLRVVAATLRDLRAEVASRRFRDDLYHRIGRPEVKLMALRERLEDIPWLVQRAVERVASELAVHPSLVETCLLRPWPGNARELVGEVRRAALAARDAGRSEVRATDLEPCAGLRIDTGEIRAPEPAAPRTEPAPLPDHDTIVRALRAQGGNVTGAARVLGIHRNQLRRLLARCPELVPQGSGEMFDA